MLAARLFTLRTIKTPMTRPIVCVFRLLCAVALLWASAALAAGLRGVVTFNGVPVPGATVTATQGGKETIAITDRNGAYDFSNLAEGPCTLEIQMTGFSAVERTMTVVPNTPATQWNLKLLPLSQMNAVTAPPLDGNTPLPEAPAATAKAQGNASAPPPTEEMEQRAASGLLVNGSVNNSADSPFAQSAAFGNNRSRHGLYNGNIGVTLDNSAIDARPYSLTGLNTPKPTYNLVTGMASFGGPLRIPHVLLNGPNIIANYQWTRDRDATTQSNTVPTLAERSGNFSQSVGPSGSPIQIFDPATGLPFPGDALPAIDPQAKALLSFYPLPNVSNGTRYNYQIPIILPTHEDRLQARLNKQLNAANQMWGTFGFLSTRSSTPNLFNFVDHSAALGIATSIYWQHRFSPRFYITSGYQFSRYRIQLTPFFADRENVSAQAGITGNNQDPTNWGPPELDFSSILRLSDGQSTFNRNETNRVSYSMYWNRERHNFTFGGDFRRQEFNVLSQQDPRGTFTFTGAATEGMVNGVRVGGSDIADFLLGTPDASSIAFGNADKYFRQPVYDAFISDDWRVTPGFTANIGIRWEYGAPITELQGRLVNLDIASGFAAAKPVVASSPRGPVTGTKYPSSLLWPDRSGFEPRIGLAWRPLPASSLVIRAGYGIYDDTSIYQRIAGDMAQQAPLSKSLSVQNSPACRLTLAGGFNPCPSTTENTFAVDPHLRVGYAQDWQLQIQRDLPGSLQLMATYSGVKGTHGLQQYLPNTYPIGGASPCPGCPVGFAYLVSGGNSTRQAGSVQLRRRLHNGLTAKVEYTFSKSVDDDAALGGQGPAATGQSADNGSNASGGESSTSDSATGALSGLAIAQNWMDLRAERSLSNFDQRHLVDFTLAYTTGMGMKGGTLLSGWKGALYKEWTIFTEITAGSGLPVSPSYPAAVPGTGFTGTIRPNLTGAPIYRGPAGYFLNPAAYSAPAPGEWGTAGRNSIIGPREFALDASLGRTFRVKNKYSLDLRVDSTNMLNHVTYTGWNTTIDSGQFGLPVASNAMRRLQTTVRFRF